MHRGGQLSHAVPQQRRQWAGRAALALGGSTPRRGAAGPREAAGTVTSASVAREGPVPMSGQKGGPHRRPAPTNLRALGLDQHTGGMYVTFAWRAESRGAAVEW